jgi:hypothetical protein
MNPEKEQENNGKVYKETSFKERAAINSTENDTRKGARNSSGKVIRETRVRERRVIH